jgi:hypothetical protein
MNTFVRTILATLLLLCISLSAQAQQDYYVDVTNKTGFTILHMYVSPADAKNWEEDVLGSGILQNGETQRVNLNGYFSPVFDIRLVDEEGDSYTFWNLNVVKYDLVVTLDSLD